MPGSLAARVTYLLEPKNWLIVTVVGVGAHADGLAGAAWGLLAAFFAAVLPTMFISYGIRHGRWEDRNVGARRARLVVLGFITNRMNVSITGMEGSTGVRYFPKWSELAVTGMIIGIGFAAFGLAVKYLPIFPKEEVAVETSPEPSAVAVGAVMDHAGD